MKKAVTIVLRNTFGQVLGVSRKDDHNDFGLVGGSIESWDRDIYAAAVREAKEETGLDIFDLELVNAEVFKGTMEHTFIANFIGIMGVHSPCETGKIKWIEPKELWKGSFGEYNKKLFGNILPKFYE